jgi:Holliday junction resolvasome RuvABC endonuclease subunit
VAEAACGLEGVVVYHCDPSQAKWAITGRRFARKEQVRRCLELHGFQVDGKSDDETDALAVAVWWVRCERLTGPREAEGHYVNTKAEDTGI